MNNNVTIGIPVFNEEARIEQAVRSAVGQCEKLIISDNASTDRTGEICQRLADEFSNIQYTRQPSNLGANQNWKFILDRVDTRFLLFLGSHDQLAPGSIENLLSTLESDPCILGAYGRLIYDYDGRLEEDILFNNWTGGTENTPHSRIKSLVYSDISLGWAIYGLFRTKTIKELFHHSLLPQGGDIILLGHILSIGKIKLSTRSAYYAWVRNKRKDKSDIQERTLGNKTADKKRFRNESKIAKHEMLMNSYPHLNFLDNIFFRIMSSIHIGTFKYPGFDFMYYALLIPAKITRVLIRFYISFKRYLFAKLINVYRSNP